MKAAAIVVKPYQRPYPSPIAVTAGEVVVPDFDKTTDVEGWVWCTAADGRSGWTPRAWLTGTNGEWCVDRDFDAIELTIVPGEVLEIELEESGFLWVRNQKGELGWVPGECLSFADRA